MKNYLFGLSGEMLGTMPEDEALATIRTETSDCFARVSSGPGYLIARFDEKYLGPICDRLALTHEVGEHLCSFDPEDISPVGSVELPEGSFAVRGYRFEGRMKDIDSQKMTRTVGEVLSRKNDVDLRDPNITVRMLMSDRCHLFILRKKIDADLLRQRKVSERPFFSPISLHPRYARALINLTGVKRGGTVLDPFCGTGGIMIEAAEMGIKAIASDFDPEMVAGTRENMDFYHLALHDYETMDVEDISSRFSDVDAVVCDPPYGRSAKTGGEKIDCIYGRALEAFSKVLSDGGKAGIILPHTMKTPFMHREAVYEQFVHGSLSRYYHLFGKNPDAI